MRAKVYLVLVTGLLAMTQYGCSRCCCAKLVDDTVIDCNNALINIDVLANDKISSGDKITSVTVITPPDAALGSVGAPNADNTIPFTPVTDASGTATFVYQVCFQESCFFGKRAKTCCKTAQVTVYLRPTGETQPTAVDDPNETADPGSAGKELDVLANDINPNSGLPGGDKLELASVGLPSTAGSTATIKGDKILYVPDPTLTDGATDTFTYTVKDSCGEESEPATVTVTVGTLPTTTSSSSSSTTGTDTTSSSSSSGTTTGGVATLRVAEVTPPPAKVLIVNNSKYQITVYVGAAQVDVVQPLGSTVAPASVASGKSQSVRVDALLPRPRAPRVTTETASLDPDGRYTITYTDGQGGSNITVTATP